MAGTAKNMKSPLIINWRSEIIPLTAVAATVVISALSYSRLPETVVSHWNFAGEANGWTTRNFHVIFFPLLMAAMYILFLALPYLDPKKERYLEFAKTYNIIRNLIMLVMLAVYLIATLVNLGYDINIAKTVPLLIGAMMIVMGNYMGKLKKNWFVGIKTPWTLSSENVWLKTHRLGGRMFVLFGLILIVTPYFPASLSMPLFIVGISAVAAVPLVASYFFFKEEERKGSLSDIGKDKN